MRACASTRHTIKRSHENQVKSTALLLQLSALALTVLPFDSARATSFNVPENPAPDRNGVDLAAGVMMRRDTFLSIGDPSAGGLDLQYTGYSIRANYNISLLYTSSNTETSSADNYSIRVGDSQQLFYQNCLTVTCNSGQERFNTLIKSGSNWIYTTSNGTIYTLNSIAEPVDTYNGGGKILGYATSILYPNGNLIQLGYDGTILSYILSNQGWAIKYGSGYIYAVNTLAHTCDATITCDSYDNTLTIGTFTKTDLNGRSVTGSSITDALGNASKYYGFWHLAPTIIPGDNYWGLQFYESPTGIQYAAEYGNLDRVSAVATLNGTWTYQYSDSSLQLFQTTVSHTVTVRGPDNAIQLTAYSSKKGAGLYYADDALTRRTAYGTLSGLRPGSNSLRYYIPSGQGYHEGNGTSFAYDARGNVTSVTNTPKTGSVLSPTSITAGYPSACTYPKTCNQPMWTKDSKGNQTDYTYDNNHGGVLTVTLPASQNGLRQRTYNTYTTFDTGAGIVYRLTRTETCGLAAAQLTLTACPALVTTSVTVVNYGTSTTAPKTFKSSLPYTITQTDGASSLSATTTYAYDNVGNVISVDGPLAGAVDQSFTTYDANRRKIYEIGPIPGGIGTQKRILVRHAYNGDGQETQTAQGYANINATNGSDAIFTAYSRMTYDAAGRLIKTEAITKEVAVP